MARTKKITLCWYARVGSRWQYFPVIYERVRGQLLPRHGWVLHNKVETEYPVGRYVLRSYTEGRKVYTPVPQNFPSVAMAALERTRRAAIADGVTRDPRKLLKTATSAYIKDCKAQGHMEAAGQARVVLGEFVPLCVNVHWVKHITREHILAFHQKLRDRGCVPRTIANKDARLRSFLRFCDVDTSFLPSKPKYEESEPEIYTPGEIKTIFGVADEYMGIVVRMALMLGLREQEIMYSEWADVDWHHATFRVQGKPRLGFAVKDYAQRLIPIKEELLQMLAEWQKLRPETTLIVGDDRGVPEGHMLRKLKRLAHRAGLNCGQCASCLKSKECERWFLHKFRATFCTRMLRETDPATVMKLAGHSNIETTMRYLAPASGEKMQAHANAINWTE